MKKLLLSFTIIITVFIYWIFEPWSVIPFISAPKALASSHSDSQCQMSTSLQSQADDIINRYINNAEFLGLSAGVHTAKCGTYTAVAGFRNKGEATPFETNTPLRIASLTKPMTAIAIMQLHESGRLDINAPIQSYLPNWPHPMTVKQLLGHTAGIPHYSSKFEAMSFTHYANLEMAVKTIGDKPLTSVPGTQYTYSSYGYTILGQVIETVSDMSFEDYMRTNIWQKASMKNTALEPLAQNDAQSKLYLKIAGNYMKAPKTDLSVIYPAGGVISTAGDILKFGQAIIDDRLISRDSLELMIDVSGSLSPAAGDDPYGLGWTVYNTKNKGRVLAHSGSQPGASAYFEIWLEEQTVSVALSNAFGTKSSAYQLVNELRTLAKNENR